MRIACWRGNDDCHRVSVHGLEALLLLLYLDAHNHVDDYSGILRVFAKTHKKVHIQLGFWKTSFNESRRCFRRWPCMTVSMAQFMVAMVDAVQPQSGFSVTPTWFQPAVARRRYMCADTLRHPLRCLCQGRADWDSWKVIPACTRKTECQCRSLGARHACLE